MQGTYVSNVTSHTSRQGHRSDLESKGEGYRTKDEIKKELMVIVSREPHGIVAREAAQVTGVSREWCRRLLNELVVERQLCTKRFTKQLVVYMMPNRWVQEKESDFDGLITT
jgi:hypothetical protein